MGCVSDACEMAEINRTTAYRYQKQDAEFAQAWRDALEVAVDRLEKEAFRRAHNGVKTPVYHSGRLAGHVQKYSDVLLIFLLKGARPEKYRDYFKHEHTGPGGGPMQVRSLQHLNDTELNQLEELVAKVSIHGGSDSGDAG